MLGNKINFKKARIPSKKKLNGKYCFLEPVNSKKHSKDLFKNFSLDKKGTDWIYMPAGPYKTEKSLKKYLKAKNFTGNPFFYAIYSKRLQTYCGLASYLRIKPQIGTIEVGWITYAPNLQRTVEATEVMYLMMKNAFEGLGYRRYEWKCDNLNKRSKKSALRVGLTPSPTCPTRQGGFPKGRCGQGRQLKGPQPVRSSNLLRKLKENFYVYETTYSRQRR